MHIIPCHIAASSRQNSALGIFHVHGGEAALSEHLDARVGPRSGRGNPNPLSDNEVRYGWLAPAAGGSLDEVLIARPHAGMRIVMTHGGGAVRNAVAAYLEGCGFPCGDEGGGRDVTAEDGDAWYGRLLSRCVTEAQAAAVLAARAEGRGVPAGMLATRRVVLAGAPNAGKSSLLNCLAGYDRAFVHAEAGATRDVVDEVVDVGGYAVLLGDLPGFGAGMTGVAGAAWEAAAGRLRLAEWVWFVVDGAEGWGEGAAEAAREVAECLAGREDAPGVLVVINKRDAGDAVVGEPWRRWFPDAEAVRVSSLPGGDAAAVLSAVVRF